MDKHSFARRHLYRKSYLSFLLYPASLLYAGYMLIRRKYLFPKPYRAPFKVISVGNLSLGGSGKSPLTIALAKALRNKGFRLAISSRGYKAGWEETGGIIHDGRDFVAKLKDSGDEAWMVASALKNIPVYVGRKRREILKMAEANAPEIMILDDALQHLGVARDLDIIVFDASIGCGNGFCLPAGYLREPLSALPDKALIVIHSKNGASPSDKLIALLKAKGKPLFIVQSRAGAIYSADGAIPLSALESKSISLVSGIAQPHSFEESVRSLGLGYDKHYAFSDHHAFEDKATLETLLADKSDYLLCTHKDAVKLQRYTMLQDKLLWLELELSLADDLVDRIIMEISL
ncbi:MAG: tetraacyldisaccharide 4'-kinase [Candidatus Cloacimonetes bacterium]|nr:tetraacyldisaccharide 4'-kinase [Candidatus Cloacimonadota bacterium]